MRDDRSDVLILFVYKLSTWQNLGLLQMFFSDLEVLSFLLHRERCIACFKKTLLHFIFYLILFICLHTLISPLITVRYFFFHRSFCWLRTNKIKWWLEERASQMQIYGDAREGEWPQTFCLPWRRARPLHRCVDHV